MKITKERLIRIINEEVAALREGRFSDISKPVTDNPTKYKIPPMTTPDKPYMAGDQKGAYREPPVYSLEDDDPYEFGDTISETILDRIVEKVGEDNEVVDSMGFIKKVTHYVYNQLRSGIGEQLWHALKKEWDDFAYTQGQDGLVTEKIPQKWLQEKMIQHSSLENAVEVAYEKFVAMTEPSGTGW